MEVHTWQPGMFERECGGCTMCCKLPSAPAPLNKPAGVWCQFCRPGKERCTIYNERPQGCRDFMCLWKIMPDFPEELRPDRCKVMWTMTGDGSVAVATTEYPKALEAAPQRRLVARFRQAGIRVEARISRPPV